MEQNTNSDHIHFCGYDAADGVFLLQISSKTPSNATSTRVALIRREIGDFQSLDRALPQAAKSSSPTSSSSAPVARLSLRRLKKLAETSWTRNDTTAGWRLEFQKNVVACEQWLAMVLRTCSHEVSQRFVDDVAYAAHHAKRLALRQETQHAKRLQQYFTSESLVQFVVTRLQSMLAIQISSSGHVLWLEPSCGDGRMVQALVDARAPRIIGYELDDALCAAASKRFQQHSSIVTIQQGDFLASHPPPSDASTTTVIAFGNPPFGLDTDADKCDLVAQFVVHVAQVWRAELIAFIVPRRCIKDAYLARLVASMATTIGDWSVALAEPLEHGSFECNATKRTVKQPSALLVLARRSSGSLRLLK